MSYLRFFVVIYVEWCLTHIVLCCILFCFSSVSYVTSFSGLSIFDCPSVFPEVYLINTIPNEH